jgi:creatinine amidohydrolase/Fe(II)-dependent formamide hydrolase-like protein
MDILNKNMYSCLTFLEASQLKEDTLALLPIGAIEQHGPHLPINTDLILAEEFGKRIVSRWSHMFDIVIMPSIPFGLSFEHQWAKGTMSLSILTFASMIMEIWKQIYCQCGIKNIVVINGHGGNRGILDALIQEARNIHGINVCITHPSSMSVIGSNSRMYEVHGGKSETSVMLELCPSLVRMANLPKQPISIKKNENVRTFILDRGQSWPWSSGDDDIALDGIIGDAWMANRDLGLEIVSSALESYENVFNNILKSNKKRNF